MGKKDKKSKEKKEKAKLKKEKQKLKSLKSKKKKTNSLNDEDFETICLYYENLNKKNKYGHININTTSNNSFVECEKPSPRSNCSITFINEEEFLLFGGEYNNNNELIAYNDLFKYNVVKDKWKYYFTTCKKPKPRCSHQAVYFNKKLYIFGGELCTNTQFFHYNDFWAFDIKNNVFEELETKNNKDDKPSPRSGHRMILWKSSIVMFGGFFDNGKSVEYFNDIYMYIINSNKWINLTNIYTNSLFKKLAESSNRTTPGKDSQNNDINNVSETVTNEKKKNRSNDSQILKSKFFKNFDLDSYMPSKRSSVSLFTDIKFKNIYIYGGYSQVKCTSRNAIGVYYNDLWVLNINFVCENNISVNFKKLKKSTFQPSKRVGFSTCVYKNSLFLFGGVFDQIDQSSSKKNTNKGNNSNSKNNNQIEESLNMNSIFFNDLYVFDMNKEHWSYLSLKNIEAPNLKKNTKELEEKGSNKLKLKENNENNSNNGDILVVNEEKIETEDEIKSSRKKKKNKLKDTDFLDSYDSTNLYNDDNDDEYYSNIFVYFDENGNKKIIQIDKDEGEKSETSNDKKECNSDITKNEESYILSNKEEKYNIVDQNIDNNYSVAKNCSYLKENNNNNTELNNGNINNSKEEKNNCCINGDISNFIIKAEVKEEIHEEINEINNLANSDIESNNEEHKKMKFIINDIEPIGRINSHIFVINKDLYLFGGMYEYKNNEIMLNDYWKINIFKREKWNLLDKGNLDEIYVEESDSSSIISIDDSNKDEKEIEDLILHNKIKKIENKIKMETFGLNFDPNESLNEFFARTKQHWLKELNIPNENKQSRKDAFILCEKKYVELKVYYKKIDKYRELLLDEEYDGSVDDDDSNENEENSSSIND
ncbi:kelch protein, putative [Plasmodium berghei]|uniref:Kelch protein K10, putative n=2 Tax=Plasmodium berghei TaxID=5821 RepID=A0A509AG30_PLABA|nr:kelch protein K10, putative [Plasmodium berghei ANKA]CXI08477.1 kelch protein, putative [Plasmodium berghei]SCL92733.1 kelch protein, putative [Plasmodium berghei]SCM15704.1 kelch protein, putative [Plasmodium berghei]SCM17498.1 kelch protein, putative [Plasmodium berghei]SCN22892.1 kelch protein, putative [Plasmodium berghei]|eukprot:XP_034420309.1 kelch protein K10, putative [Plasmodium berghei ANKA]